ncbi:MAG: hybrid sensor histidine kinase/response regulator [Burkholderia sp.]|nr:hybrid sensor histidine kinase/response regulator [Burkholderia sp.]
MSMQDRIAEEIFEGSPDCVKVLDSEGRLLAMNRNGQCAMEIDDFEAVRGKPWSALWPEESREAIELALKAARDGRTGRVSAYCPTAKGTPRWWDVTVNAMPGSEGADGYLLSISRDVTGLHGVVDALQVSEERFRLLIAATSAIVWTASADGAFEGEQASWRNYTGQSAAAAHGAGWLDALHPDDREATVEAWRRSVSTGTPFEAEYRLRRHDGVYRHVNARALPMTDRSGQIREWAGVHADITERKQVEARLRLLDEMNEATRNASDPRVIMEEVPRLLGEHLRATRCAYADVEPNNDQFTIRHDWDAPGAASSVGAYSLDLFGPRAARDMREGRTLVIRDVDRELTPSEGGSMFNAIGVKAIICCPLVKEGKLVAMMAVHQDAPRDWTAADVTLLEEVVERSWAHIERIRAMETLRVEDRRKSEFLAVLAHELRNPLAPIRNGLQVMRVAADNPATVSRVRDVMERQLAHLVHLVDDLLDIARINRGKVDLQKVRVELRTVVASAVETSLPAIEARRHELNLHIPDQSLALTIDPTRISQVISNLLTNAAKYTPAGGRIDVTARRDGDDVVLSVSDTGMGIPPESIGTIFEMFTQVGNNLERTQGGLGIGLALARRLVELHAGTIAASSPGLGQGTTFDVRLPLAAIEPLAPAADDNRHDGNGGRRFRILVVDDNADAAETMSDYLDMSGYASQVAYNGYQALDVIRRFMPEVVFLDIGMPGMNGYEVASAIRKMPEMSGVTLIALTGWGSGTDRSRAHEAGFDHHLTKPASFHTVNALLTALH